MFEQLGLIGCGLMGGSFALALKRAGLVKRVVGYSKSPSTTERARQLGVIDVEAPSALLAVSGADIVLLAVPVAATEATFKAIRHLVTPRHADHGRGLHQTRCGRCRTARPARPGGLLRAGPPGCRREVAGVENADPELYTGKQVILTPIERTHARYSCSRPPTSGRPSAAT
jgi:prephenate dehydrogenase